MLRLPKRLLSPICRKAHGCGIDVWIAKQKHLQVANEGIACINGIEPVGYAAKVGIQRFVRKREYCNPFTGHHCGGGGLYRICAIPYTGVMGAMVAQSGKTFQPTGQKAMVIQSEIAGHSVLQLRLAEVVEQFRQDTERHNFERFPYRRKVWFGVLAEVFSDISLSGTVHFLANRFQVLIEAVLVDGLRSIHKPERATRWGYVLDDLRAHGHFNSLDGSEKQGFKSLSK